MRLGIIVQFYQFRNDLRRLIQRLNQKYEVVLFTNSDIIDDANASPDVREIKARKRGKRNLLVDWLYELSGNRPADRKNFYNYQLRILDATPGRLQWNSSRLRLELARWFPTIMKYDSYIQCLDFSRETNIQDIDVFLNFSAFDENLPYLLAHIVESKKPLVEYVYSWDHPGKYVYFSRKYVQYLTWNNDLKDDLEILHKIPSSHIEEIGSSQFTYLHEYLTDESFHQPVYEFDYVYYCASAGKPELMKQEIPLIKLISKILFDIAPEMKLVVRPYPRFSNWNYYNDLLDIPNLIIDDYRDLSSKYTFSEKSIVEKYNKIKYSKVFINFCSTIGVEASYFDTPVLQLDLQELDFVLPRNHPSSLYRFVNTYHSKKYLLLYNYPNVVQSQNELKDALIKAINDPMSMLEYNRNLSSRSELKSMEKFVEDISHILELRMEISMG